MEYGPHARSLLELQSPIAKAAKPTVKVHTGRYVG